MEVAGGFRLMSRLAAAVFLFCLWAVSSGYGQLGPNTQIPDSQRQNDSANDTLFGTNTRAEDELNQGTVLTGKGAFKDAIPHLLAAQGRVANQYAAGFNLALCYVATNQFTAAIRTLHGVIAEGHS